MLELRNIMLVFGLLLLQTAACMERFCNFTQSDACYAALGHKLNLLMVLNASKYDLVIKKRMINNTDGTEDPVFKVKYGNLTKYALYDPSKMTVTDGTLIINPVKREDSGNYTLELDTKQTGGAVTHRYLQVNVEAPVSSVKVSIICSSNQMRSVSCSSEGDQLLYSWTLNGNPLMDGNSSIQLEEGTEGEITCTVKNHVSQENKTVRIKDCHGSTTGAVASNATSKDTKTNVAQYLLISLGCVAVILILMFIIVYHIYRKKQHKSPTPAPPSGDVELIYTHISHQKPNKQGPGRKKETSPDDDVEYSAVRVHEKKKNKPEEEIQYGEVTFSHKHSRTQKQQQQQPAEECVYSDIHRS
ncbi:uncharacterized protein LOC130241098 isoform X2 [Danio aesculapii]|uniref:uncharacterized protein LOC130241098 isoform X2 n=1 Tax=Danio aesculapii TaxID=1142201 RepID=UPI0024BFBB1A|nr:uncharacterized protein LOC130241098 isoform X2 [Danio aesculapii]